MDPIRIGKFISELRKKNGLTQSELANMLNVTNQAVSKWENGRGIPDIEMLKKLSEVFHIHVDELLEGQVKQEKKKNYGYYFAFGLFFFLFILGLFFLFFKKDDSFQFSRLASDNDAFSIKGVIAYNKNKKSIYISEVHYDQEDEEKYREIECILYESTDKNERLIGKWGEITKEEKNAYYLTDLLKGIEFNIDNYECSCEAATCNNLYLRINALNPNEKVITYKIPIQIDTACEG